MRICGGQFVFTKVDEVKMNEIKESGNYIVFPKDIKRPISAFIDKVSENCFIVSTETDDIQSMTTKQIFEKYLAVEKIKDNE